MEKPKMTIGTLYTDENIRIKDVRLSGERFYKSVYITDSEGFVEVHVRVYADGTVEIC